MTSATTILDQLRRRGVTFRLDGTSITFSPGEAVDGPLLAEILQNQAALIAALEEEATFQTPPAPSCPECGSDPGDLGRRIAATYATALAAHPTILADADRATGWPRAWVGWAENNLDGIHRRHHA